MEREKSGREEIFKFSPSTGQPVGTETKIRARLGGMVIEEEFLFFLSFLSVSDLLAFGEGDERKGKGGVGCFGLWWVVI